MNAPRGSHPDGQKGKASQSPRIGPANALGHNQTPPPPGRARHALPRTSDPADVLINQIIDLEAEGQLHDARAIYAESCSHDPDFEDRYAATREPLALMRVDLMPRGLDLSSRIIERVESERPYLPREHRRRIGGTRMLIGSAVFALFTVGAIMQISIDRKETQPPHSLALSETQPQTVASLPSNAGVSDVVSSLGRKVPGVVSGIAENIEHTQIGLHQLRLGNAARYEGSTYIQSTDFLAAPSAYDSMKTGLRSKPAQHNPHHQLAAAPLPSQPARLSLLTSSSSATILPSVSGTFGIPAHLCQRCGGFDCFQDSTSSLTGHGLFGTMNQPSIRILDLDEDAAKKNRPGHSTKPIR